MITKTAKTKKSDESYVRPFIKWVGGKTQILSQLIEKFPNTINNYHEIFLGGGSVLFAFLKHVQDGTIVVNGTINAYDLNKQLINIYINIQTNYEEVFNETSKLINVYNSCKTIVREKGVKPNINPTKKQSTMSTENYYYWIRNEYNKMELIEQLSLTGSAMTIFLNKTCFRGVYRIGPNGFNVPFGNNKNPEIVNLEHLREISNLIQNVNFKCCDFASSMSVVKYNDFLYMDPPYVPEKKTSFVGYTGEGFNIDNHISLFQTIEEIRLNGANIMMSNADVDLVREHFDKEKYCIESILCKRAIHSTKPGSKTLEVIITNN